MRGSCRCATHCRMSPQRSRKRSFAMARAPPNSLRLPWSADAMRVSFWLDDVLVVADGGRASSYTEEDGQRVMKQDEITVRVTLDRGSAKATVWTCDLSHEYVSINADYRS